MTLRVDEDPKGNANLIDVFISMSGKCIYMAITCIRRRLPPFPRKIFTGCSLRWWWIQPYGSGDGWMSSKCIYYIPMSLVYDTNTKSRCWDHQTVT